MKVMMLLLIVTLQLPPFPYSQSCFHLVSSRKSFRKFEKSREVIEQNLKLGTIWFQSLCSFSFLFYLFLSILFSPPPF